VCTRPVLLSCEPDRAPGRRIRKQLGEQGVPAAVAAEILAEVRAAGGVEKARGEAGALRAHGAGGGEKARGKAVALAEEAAGALEALPRSPYRDALRALAHLSADRSS